jgi:hypothetical protein
MPLPDPPVDPDIEEARKLGQRYFNDNTTSFEGTLIAAIKRGRELQKSEVQS